VSPVSGTLTLVGTGPEAPTDESPPSKTTVPSWFDRLLWLGPRVAAARFATFTHGQPGFDLYDIARQLRDEACRAMRAGRGSWVVLGLDCIALELLVRAHLVRAGQSAVSGQLGEADWAMVRQLPSLEAAWGGFPPAHMATLMAAAGVDRIATLTRLPDEARRAFPRDLHQLVQGLIAPLDFDANRLGWALFARWSRMAAVGVLLAIMLGYAASPMISETRPNLALHRQVSVSSLNGYGDQPSRLVDGITDETGFHTNDGEQQWVVIDLGEVKKFDEIVIYNRPGCCAERAVPLKVEVSDDNQNFRQIAERVEIFDKWRATNLRAEGRYIRLKNTPPNYFHLAEVEVY
jgi:hypothetical protein